MLYLAAFLVFLGSIAAQDKDYVTITNCPSSYSQGNFEIDKPIRVEVKWNSDDESLLDNYNWNFQILYNNRLKGTVETVDSKPYIKKGHIFEVPAYTIFAVQFSLTITATRKPGSYAEPESPLSSPKQCFIERKGFVPLPRISYGSIRLVLPGQKIKMSARTTVNSNNPKDKHGNLTFEWSCTNLKTETKLCPKKKPFSTAAEFYIVGSKIVKDDEINVELRATAHIRENILPSTEIGHQKIIVTQKIAKIRIDCKKNCPDKNSEVNPERDVELSVSCLKQCTTVWSNNFTWHVNKPFNKRFQFDYQKAGLYKQRKRMSYGIKKNSIVTERYDNTYEISVIVKTSDVMGVARMRMIYSQELANAEREKCTINPKEGDNINTNFRLSCKKNAYNAKHVYEVHAVGKKANGEEEDEVIFAETLKELKHKRFNLPPSDGKKFYVKVVRKEDNDADVLPLTVKVNPFLANKNAAELLGLVPFVQKEIDEDLKSDDADKRKQGLSKLDDVINHLDNKSADESIAKLIEKLKADLTDNLIELKMDDTDEIVKAGGVLNKLQSINEPNATDPALAKKSTDVCKKMAIQFLNVMEAKDKNKSDDMAQIIADCNERQTKPSDEKVSPLNFNITVETVVNQTDEGKAVAEDYPDYVDYDETHYKNLEYLQNTTNNVLNSSASSAKILAVGSQIGEGVKRITKTFQETLVFKDTGKNLANNTFVSFGLTIIPSKDFQNDTHFYDLVMTTWRKDLVWWNPGKIKIRTNIVDINFWHSTCKDKVQQFTKPVELFFKLRKNANYTVEVQSFSAEFIKTNVKDAMNRNIRVHKIFLPGSRKLFIHFHDLIKGQSFQTVITQHFPTIEDFIETTPIELEVREQLFVRNRNNYDSYLHLGILPSDTSTSIAYDYSMSTFVAICLKWIQEQSKWVPTCHTGGGGNDTCIHCMCANLSMLAGHYLDVPNTHQELQITNLTLELQAWYVIYITLAITWIIYFIAITFTSVREEEQFYYLADNNSTDRYAYFLIIRTGLWFTSSTSSNIVIKIVGEKAASKPHVLNYPDPSQKMLQRLGSDKFVLTTRKHLGEIQEIHLWHDAIGPSPKWYCKDIIVFDMQEHTEWHFPVKQQMSLLKNTTYVFVTSTKNEELKFLDDLKRKQKIKFEMGTRFHTWNLLYDEKYFSRLARFSVIFSTVMMIHTLALLLYGLPEMVLRDSLDEPVILISRYTLLVALLSSCPTFLVHSTIAWCFRFGNQLQDDEKRYKTGQNYTWLCWAALIVIILVSTSILVTFGFWKPHNKSMAWLAASLIGITFGVVVLEIPLVILQSYWFKIEIKYKILRQFRTIKNTTERQREYLYRQFGEPLLRPYFTHLYTPLHPKEIREKLAFLVNKYNVSNDLQNLMMFLVYNLLLYLVILASRDKFVVYSNMSMFEMLHGKHMHTFNFRHVMTLEDIYTYINKTLIPSVIATRWYGNHTIEVPAMCIDHSQKFLGVVRLRQLRVKPVPCHVSFNDDFYGIEECWPEYSWKTVDRESYGFSWSNRTIGSRFDRMGTIWRYASATGENRQSGEFATYEGNGYLAYLGRTLYNSYVNLLLLKQKSWIDPNSRVVFIEFLTYNVNANIFNAVLMLFEQSASGYLVTRIQIDSARFLYVKDEDTTLTLVFVILFLIWVLVFLIFKCITLFRKIRSFYKDIWLLIDFVIIALSIITFFLTQLRQLAIKRFLNDLEERRHNEFVRYFHFFSMNYWVDMSAFSLIFVSAIRLWKFVRFLMIFRIMETTLMMGGPYYLCFFLMHFIFMLAFSQTLILLVGNQFPWVYTLGRTMKFALTLPLTTRGMNVKEYVKYPVAVGYVTVVGVMLELTFFLYITITVIAYSEAQKSFSTREGIYTIKHYLIDKFKYCRMLIKYRRKGGDDNFYKVYPKSDKFLYANSFSIPTVKIQLMRGIMFGVLRNKKKISKAKLTKRDLRIMADVSLPFLNKMQGQDTEVFYKGRIQGQKVRLVHEKGVENIANVVNLLLQQNVEYNLEENEGMIERQKCVQTITHNQKTLEKCSLNLKLLLFKMGQAEFDIGKLH